MNKYNFMIPLLIFALFCCSACEKKEDVYSITIQNNYDKEIIFIFSEYVSVSETPQCLIQNMTKQEYSDFIYDKMIKPYSSKKIGIDWLIETMNINPDKMLSIGIFHRIDVDTMSCEEFKQIYPLKKEWKITLADMEAYDWTLVYTPEE